MESMDSWMEKNEILIKKCFYHADLLNKVKFFYYSFFESR